MAEGDKKKKKSLEEIEDKLFASEIRESIREDD